MIRLPIVHISIPLIFFQLFIVVILFLAFIIISFIVLVLLLDEAYRKEAKQYSKHILWDTISPIVLLITPSILVMSLTHYSIFLMDKFLLIICIHGFIIIPLMHFWSTHRKWDLVSEAPLNSWNHPRIYLRIAIALIYPAIFGSYYTILRYLRIGQTVDIYKAFDFMNIQDIFPYIILSLFIWPFISVWIRLFLWKLMDLRLFFWDEFSSLISLINIIILLLLLRPFIYFLNHFNGLENRWDKPRYPERFWLSFSDIREYLDNQPPMTKSLADHIRIQIQMIREENIKNSHQILNEAYRKNSSRISRIKKGYYQWAQVRWVHTSKIITTAEPVLNRLWHPSTAFFLQTVFDYFALINNDWGHYKLIQQLEKKQRFLYPKNLYNNCLTENNPKVAEALEKNLVTNFTASKNYNILVQTYNKHVKLDTAGQAEPDISYDMKNNHAFRDKSSMSK